MAAKTLYIAVRVNNDTYEEVVERINCGSLYGGVYVVAFTSGDEAKTWVREQLQAYPFEKWLILSGTVLGETDRKALPVRFRAV